MKADSTGAVVPSRLLTIREAAAKLTISERGIRALLNAGKIRFVRVSERRLAIDSRDIDTYCDRQRRGGQAS